MKKTLLLAGVATLVFAANANAFYYKQYVSAKANYSFTSHDMEYQTFHEKPNRTGEIGFSDDVWGGSLAYGIKTCAIRTELEFNLKETAKKQFKSDKSTASLAVKDRSVMLNAYYDINTGTKFTPYVGAGLGIAMLKASERGIYSDNKSANASDSRNTFAWQIGAGVSYALNDNFNVDLGYRFLDEGHVAYKDVNSLNKYEAKAHEVSLGVRYTF